MLKAWANKAKREAWAHVTRHQQDDNEELQKSGEMDSEAQGQGGSFLKQRHYDKMNGNERQFHMNITTNCSTEHLKWAHLKQQPVAHYSWICIRQRQNMESWEVVGRNVLNLFLAVITSRSSKAHVITCVLYWSCKWECVETISRGERWCTYRCLHVSVCPVCSCSVSLRKHTIYSSVKAAGCIFLCHDTGKSNHLCSLKCVVRSKAVKFHKHRFTTNHTMNNF